MKRCRSRNRKQFNEQKIFLQLGSYVCGEHINIKKRCSFNLHSNLNMNFNNTESYTKNNPPMLLSYENCKINVAQVRGSAISVDDPTNHVCIQAEALNTGVTS